MDTSHIRSPRDPMTPEEREAVRAEIREGHEAVWRIIRKEGSVAEEWYAMLGHDGACADEPDAA